MPDSESVWIGKILRKDQVSDLSLVLVRGIFRTERDARGLAEAFGCDALMFSEPDQAVELGQVAVVNMKKARMVED